mgnify:CR=1 FL=1
MKILLVGNGGREHAIARALARTSTTDHPVELVVQAGNPGLERLGESRTLDPLDPDDVLRRALGEQVDLVVVGPEAPLVAGIADAVLERALAAGVRGFLAKEDPITTLADTIRHVASGNMVLSPSSSALIGHRATPPAPAAHSKSAKAKEPKAARKSPTTAPNANGRCWNASPR